MKRARWMLGALGAMAALAMAPALPASAQTDWGYSTEITNVANGAHWTVQPSSQVVSSSTLPMELLGQNAQWRVQRQFDGTVTIQNEATGKCAETTLQANEPVFIAPCQPWDENQRWNLSPRWDGVVITPAKALHLAVVSGADQFRDTTLTLGARPFDQNGNVFDTANAVFRLNY